MFKKEGLKGGLGTLAEYGVASLLFQVVYELLR